jgi:hypothetical protein
VTLQPYSLRELILQLSHHSAAISWIPFLPANFSSMRFLLQARF